MAKEKRKGICNFCGEFSSLDKLFFEGIDAAICENCVTHAHEIITEFNQQKAAESSLDFQDFVLIKPQELKEKLDEYVIGQDEAKMVILIGV